MPVIEPHIYGGMNPCWCGVHHGSTSAFPTFSWPSTTWTYTNDCTRCPPQSPYVARHRA